MRNSREVIYMTGPPASGKTTLVARLRDAFPNVRAFVYSEILAAHVSNRQASHLGQEELRRKSGLIVSPEDVLAVDQQLVKDVARTRRREHVLIDSHPVTKEQYGFRVTAFSVPLLQSLKPTMICMLYTHAESVIRRIKKDPKGRPTISPFEADFHCSTQMSVAVFYGLWLGIPIYFYDTSDGNENAFQEIAKRLRSKFSLLVQAREGVSA